MLSLRISRDRSFRPHFEHSENPFYDVQHYKVFASMLRSISILWFPQGDGKFSREQVRVGSPGGIFNIEFSGDGKVLAKIIEIFNKSSKQVLAAACERKSILLFDPLTRWLLIRLAYCLQNILACCCSLWDDENLKSGHIYAQHSNSRWFSWSCFDCQ